MENISLSKKDFREFTQSDWEAFQGAESPEDGTPLMYEYNAEGFFEDALGGLACIAICDNLIGFHYIVDKDSADYYDDEAGSITTWQMEIENQQQGLEILGMMRVPVDIPMIEESKALRKLGFETA